MMAKYKFKLNSTELHLLETCLAQTIGKRKTYNLPTKEYSDLLVKIDKQVLKQLENGTNS
jgi:hypothetical protein